VKKREPNGGGEKDIYFIFQARGRGKRGRTRMPFPGKEKREKKRIL